MKRIGFMLALLCALAGHAAKAQDAVGTSGQLNAWDQAATSLAAQIASILGPGQASFSIRNLSTIAAVDVPTIRHSIEQNLKTRGVVIGGTDSANAIHVTLSEDTRERLWVAEIIEGSETRVTMVSLPGSESAIPQPTSALVLRRQLVYQSQNPIVAALQLGDSLIVAEPAQIGVFNRTQQGWKPVAVAKFDGLRTPSRDSRATLVPSTNSHGFDAWFPGVLCSGSTGESNNAWEIHCRQTDDPWPISAGPVMPALTAAPTGTSTELSPVVAQFKAFYNSARNYFTGVVTPSPGVDLPPFYAALNLPLSGSTAGMLVEGLDGRIQIAANGRLANVQGTRDWGSDFTIVHTNCSSGMQVIASSSGAASNDNLRAYELTGHQATASGSPLTIEGTVMALATAVDGNAVYAVVRTPQDRYEVDRVSATCN